MTHRLQAEEQTLEKSKYIKIDKTKISEIKSKRNVKKVTLKSKSTQKFIYLRYSFIQKACKFSIKRQRLNHKKISENYQKNRTPSAKRVLQNALLLKFQAIFKLEDQTLL